MDGRRTTLADWWARWQGTRQVGLLTARREESAWACWIAPHLGAAHLSDLRRSTVQEWVAGQARGGVAPSTIARHLAVLRACLSAAVLDGLITVNPAARVDVPRAAKTEQRFLSVDEVQRLYEAVASPYQSMIAFGVACGLRIGELVALQAGDVNLFRQTVTVRRTVLADSGEVGPVKSRAGEGRVVPVPPRVAERLARELSGRHPAAYVWPTPGGRAWKPGNWRRDVWQPAVQRAGITPPPTPHAMRHTAVAAWLRSGASLYEASRWAGHASTTTTDHIYGHLLQPDGKVSEEVEKLFWPTEPVQIGQRRRAE
jgi:integrase